MAAHALLMASATAGEGHVPREDNELTSATFRSGQQTIVCGPILPKSCFYKVLSERSHVYMLSGCLIETETMWPENLKYLQKRCAHLHLDHTPRSRWVHVPELNQYLHVWLLCSEPLYF